MKTAGAATLNTILLRRPKSQAAFLALALFALPAAAQDGSQAKLAKPTATFSAVTAARPEGSTAMTVFNRAPLLTLPPGPPGRYGEVGASGWEQFADTKLAPYLKASDGGSRIAAAMAVGNDLVIYARADRASDAQLFAYRSRTKEIVPIAAATEMQSQLAAGASIDLAEPRLIRTGDTIWLVLQIADQFNFQRLDARLVAGGAPRLSRPFEQLTMADEPFRVGRNDVFFADTDGSLALLRPATGQCWRVAPGGRLVRQPGRQPRPVPAAPPLLLPAKPGEPRRILEFIADVPARADPSIQSTEATQFPQLIVRTDTNETIIDRQAMSLRLGFPARALRLTAWCADGQDVFAYDAMSGEIFRLELKDLPAN